MGAGTMPFPYTNTYVAITVSGAGTPGVVPAGGTLSVGTQADLMKACCGGEYTLPTGSTVNPGAVTAQEGSFSTGYRQLYMSGAFAMSLAEGDLATWTDPTFTYASVTAQCAVVYGDDGAVLS